MYSPNVRGIDVIDDWQTEKTTFPEKAQHLLETSLYSDCEFLVGNGDDQKVFRAHKNFLAMSSPVFEAMFFGRMAQLNSNNGSSVVDQKPIEVPDIQSGTFSNLLQFIYTQHVKLGSFYEAAELYHAAKKYMIPKLVARIYQLISLNMMTEKSCLEALELAIFYNDALLRDLSLSFIRCHTKELLQISQFEEISEPALVLIVTQNHLNISTEFDLFRAVKRWAIKECSRREIEPSGSNMRLVLRDVIRHIRFLTMSSEEFADGPATSSILSESEKLAIALNIKTRYKWPMPENFSSSRNKRFPWKQDRPSSETPDSATIRSGKRESQEGSKFSGFEIASSRSFCLTALAVALGCLAWNTFRC